MIEVRENGREGRGKGKGKIGYFRYRMWDMVNDFAVLLPPSPQKNPNGHEIEISREGSGWVRDRVKTKISSSGRGEGRSKRSQQ